MPVLGVLVLLGCPSQETPPIVGETGPKRNRLKRQKPSPPHHSTSQPTASPRLEGQSSQSDGAPVHGVVRSSIDGSGLAGVRVEAWSADGQNAIMAWTDPAGHFVMHVPRKKTFTLSTEPPGHGGVRVSGVRGQRANLELRVQPLVAVELLLRGAKLPDGATGRLLLSKAFDRDVQERPLVAGKARIGVLSAGRYVLHLRARYKQRVWIGGPLGFSVRGERLRLQLDVGELKPVSGKVVDGTGAPVPGARIQVLGAWGAPRRGRGAPGGELGVIPGPVPPIPPAGVVFSGLRDSAAVVSDSEGAFTYSGVRADRPFRIVVDHPDYLFVQTPWRSAAGPRTGNSIILVRAGSMEGRVVDQRALPIAGALISVTTATGRFTVRTAADGSFILRRLQGRVDLAVESPGHARKKLRVVLSKGRRRRVELKLALAGEPIDGVVLDHQLVPIQGASVKAMSGGQVTTATTARDGSFILAGLSPGEVMVRADKPGFIGAKVRHRRGVDVRLVLRPLGRLEGRVQDYRTGTPVLRFSVRGGSRKRVNVVSGDGRFVLMLAPGKNRVTVRAKGYAARSIAVKVGDPRHGANPDHLLVELRREGE